jgi:hypothetical protein
MGSKTKTTTNQNTSGTQTNTLGWSANPGSADISTLRGMVKNPNEVDPTVAYNFAARRRDYNNTFQNPLGSYTTPAAREAAERSASRNMGMEEGIAAQAARSAAQEQSFGQQAHVAAMTAPVAYNSSSSSTGNMSGNSVQSYNPGIGSYISQAAGIGVGFL